ncbi:MAG: hypothetical protein HY912_11090 [Desulfomonile tiedjei]|uniref:Uncharacterized protein n=1 Tax=Desulfomonile tiedjei TaxID=2358 RepID=A0A9D6V3C3_9BACT|nr:hypothetical protein [Desulfomonile tiedjei]
MKGLITILAILCLLFTTESVFARGGGNTRANIDRKWREVEAWKKKQDQHFNRIEREAERSLRGIRGQGGPAESIPYPGCRTRP